MAKRPKAKIDPEDEDSAMLKAPTTSERKKKQKVQSSSSSSSSSSKDDGGEDEDNSINKEKKKLEVLEAAYKNALDEFKKDKTNKDLRRAKSAAKKAYDEAVLEEAKKSCNNNSATVVVQITCKDCSQMFVHVVEPQSNDNEKKKHQKDDKKEYLHRPTRCPKCNDTLRNRLKDRSKRDSTGKNMCYDFQRGECTRGNRCKFSHNLEHGGNANKKAPIKPICHDFLKTGKCERGNKCRFRHEIQNKEKVKKELKKEAVKE